MENVRIFRRMSRDDEFPRYWIAVSTPEVNRYGKETGDLIKASISCRLSKDAGAEFEHCCEDTKNPDIQQARVDISDCWFKAVQGREDSTFVILFVNTMSAHKDRNGKRKE